MAINGVIIGLIIYLSFSVMGKGINLQIFKSKWLMPGFLGCVIYFGIIQFFVYFTNILHVPNKYLSLCYLGLLVLFVLTSLCIGKRKIFDKKYLLIVVVSIVLTSLLAFRSSYYTVGSTSDSAFYMSMVNENAFFESWTPLSYYNGTQLLRFNPLYDYQSYYHFFAYIMKMYAQFFTEISYVPIYIYSALTCYLALLIESILHITSCVFKKNKSVAVLGLMLICVFNAASWHLLYGYFGHSWRVGILSIALFSIFKYLKSDESKWLYLYGLSSSALIAVMSSALFANGFILVALLLTLLATRNKAQLAHLFAIIPEYLYLIIYILDTLYLSYKLIILFALVFLILTIIYWNIYRLTIKIRTNFVFGIVLFSFIGMFLYVFFGDSAYSFSYFFGDYVNELSVPYFGFSNLSLIITNSIWIMGALYAVINLIKNSNDDLKWFIVISIVLFVNPFVISFITQYFTKMVYYRYLEIFINYYTCFVVAYYLYEILNKYNHKLTLGILSSLSFILVYPLYVNFNNNPFFYDLIEPINPTFRVPESELEADLKIAEVANNSYERLNVVSQGEFTKAVVRNIKLTYDASYMRTFCKMCNANGMPTDAPSEMHNLFMIRDYADQPIYQQPVNWDNACNAQYESNTELLMINKNQTKLKDDIYVQIWLDMRACNDVILENDEFVVLEFR